VPAEAGTHEPQSEIWEARGELGDRLRVAIAGNDARSIDTARRDSMNSSSERPPLGYSHSRFLRFTTTSWEQRRLRCWQHVAGLVELRHRRRRGRIEIIDGLADLGKQGRCLGTAALDLVAEDRLQLSVVHLGHR